VIIYVEEKYTRKNADLAQIFWSEAVQIQNSIPFLQVILA
jgi:hypothetical protein